MWIMAYLRCRFRSVPGWGCRLRRDPPRRRRARLAGLSPSGEAGATARFAPVGDSATIGSPMTAVFPTRFAPSPTGLLHSATSAPRCSTGCWPIATRPFPAAHRGHRRHARSRALCPGADGSDLRWLRLTGRRAQRLAVSPVPISSPSATRFTGSTERPHAAGRAYPCFCSEHECRCRARRRWSPDGLPR